MVEGGGTPRHENVTLGSRLHVWGAGNIRVRVVEGGGKDTKTQHWGRVCMSGVRPGNIPASGRVLRVRVVEGGGKGPRHENAMLGSCFHVWGAGNIPDTKNATTWSCSSCQGGRGWREGPQTRKWDTGVAFSCLGCGRHS